MKACDNQDEMSCNGMEFLKLLQDKGSRDVVPAAISEMMYICVYSVEWDAKPHYTVPDLVLLYM